MIPFRSLSIIMSFNFHENCKTKPAKVVKQDDHKRMCSNCKVKASSLLQNGVSFQVEFYRN